MKRVSFSQLKSNLVGGRRRNSDSDSNNKTEIEQNCSPGIEVPSSGSKKDLHRSNNLFRVLKNKWKIKRGTKYNGDNHEESQGATALPSVDGQEFVPKKIHPKISNNVVAKRAVGPLPSQAQCIPLNNHHQETDDTYENASEIGATLNPSNNVQSLSLESSQGETLQQPEQVELIISGEESMGNNLSVSSTTGQRAGSLTKELFKLSRCGWYWGPITRSEAEEKLTDQPDGAFLVRDSSDDRYLLSLSFRSCSNTLHTRIEHSNGLFSFYAVQHQPHFASSATGTSNNGSSSQDSEGHSSIVALIEESMNYSQSGVFCYSRGRTPDSPSYPVRLTKPVSRFNQVRTLQYLCRFVIRQHTRVDHIQKLPLPNPIKGYLEESHY